MFVCLFDICLLACLVACLVLACLLGCLVAWLVGCLVAWLLGCLLGLCCFFSFRLFCVFSSFCYAYLSLVWCCFCILFIVVFASVWRARLLPSSTVGRTVCHISFLPVVLPKCGGASWTCDVRSWSLKKRLMVLRTMAA